MNVRRLARTAAAYTTAGLTTACVATIAAIPYTQPATIAAVYIDAVLLVGWPILHATNTTQGDRT